MTVTSPASGLSQAAFNSLVLEKLRRQASKSSDTQFESYQFDPTRFAADFLNWIPWQGQQEKGIDPYVLALRQLHERDKWEQGEIALDDLEYWRPGQIIKYIISIDAGHNVGKTALAAVLIRHFFTCFPSIVYCFAPNYDQINDLLFKEIRNQDKGSKLPGRVLETPEIKLSGNRFVKGKATNDAKGQGTERSQGQHNKYLMFVLDEAEGISGYVWDAVGSMSSGGISIVLILRNPRTTTCRAHKIRKQENCAAYRISCLEHPNVLEDRDIIPGSIRRQYIRDMLTGCEIVKEHDPDAYTFELPWQPGIIYHPSLEFLWRILGIASSGSTDNTFCPIGRYEAAQEIVPNPTEAELTEARIGIDCARYGNDRGTIYVNHAGRVWKDKEIVKQDGYAYYISVKNTCLQLHVKGVRSIWIRIDAGGGYHSTCVDNLNRDYDLIEMFDLFEIIEVHNNSEPYDDNTFYDLVTEMYYHAGQALKVIRLQSPAPNLEADLCERRYGHAIKTNGSKTKLDLKRLVSKEKYKDEFHRSPDDGDGCVLALAPGYIFTPLAAHQQVMPTNPDYYKVKRNGLQR